MIDAEDIIVCNDGDAYNAVMSKYGNIWTDNPAFVKSTIYNWVYNMPMKRETNKSYSYYNRDKTSINKCIDLG